MLSIRRGYCCSHEIDILKCKDALKPADWLWRLTRALQSAVFPHQCFGCDAFFIPALGQAIDKDESPFDSADINEHFTNLINPFLCSNCRKTISLLHSPMCRVCGMPFDSQVEEDHTCGSCLNSSQHIDLARACGRYTQGLRDLIHWFKYRNVMQLADPLGVLLAWGYWKHFSNLSMEMIIPVPLHPKRMRSRGFNQAYLLARAAKAYCSQSNVSFVLPDIAEKLLVRIRATKPQTGLGREHRRKNIRNAFAVTQTEAIRGKSILLVDDVYTTGATVNECARILKKAGAVKVAVLSVARTD